MSFQNFHIIDKQFNGQRVRFEVTPAEFVKTEVFRNLVFWTDWRWSWRK